MLYIASKFQGFRFIYLEVLAPFRKISFRDLVRPLVQISENPVASVKYFQMLHPSVKFQVSRFIHCKDLAIFKKKKYFSKPYKAPGSNFGKPWGTCQIFVYALPLFKISGLQIHPFQISSHIQEKQFSGPHQAPGPNFGKSLGTCQIFLDASPLFKISDIQVYPFQSSSHV